MQPALRLRPSHVPKLPKGEVVSIFTVLFIVLLLAWILGWGVFHVASGLIHILLIVAVISLILHFVRGARTV
jgi:uncharacterized protein DUF5670